MVALKGAAIETYLKRPDPALPIALVFGPDAGLVSERAQALMAASVTDLSDPFGLVRLEGDELAADPARLVDEALTVSLFGTRRGIWVKAGGRDCTRAVEALLRAPLRDCQIVIEAGDLRRNAPLRSVCERARQVAVIACYADAERDLQRLIDTELRAEGLSIAADARAALVALLGADRTASRGELRKLALYARGKAGVDLDDVMAVVADASALALDAIVDAAFAGRPAEVEAHWARARAAGTPPGRLLSAALREAMQLHRARLAVEAGESLGAAADTVVSTAQFRRRPAVETALKRWTAARLERVMDQLAAATLESRQLSGPTAPLADALAERVLLRLALAAARPAAAGSSAHSA
jgi:DNA polymerase III subunit delta